MSEYKNPIEASVNITEDSLKSFPSITETNACFNTVIKFPFSLSIQSHYEYFPCRSCVAVVAIVVIHVAVAIVFVERSELFKLLQCCVLAANVVCFQPSAQLAV